MLVSIVVLFTKYLGRQADVPPHICSTCMRAGAVIVLQAILFLSWVTLHIEISRKDESLCHNLLHSLSGAGDFFHFECNLFRHISSINKSLRPAQSLAADTIPHKHTMIPLAACQISADSQCSRGLRLHVGVGYSGHILALTEHMLIIDIRRLRSPKNASSAASRTTAARRACSS